LLGHELLVALKVGFLPILGFAPDDSEVAVKSMNFRLFSFEYFFYGRFNFIEEK